jgi:Beta protein
MIGGIHGGHPMASGIAFDHKHYVPILKTKRGELDALDSLTPAQWNALTPLLELHTSTMQNPLPDARPKKVPVPVGRQTKKVCAAIGKTGVAKKPFFLDTVWFDGKSMTGDPSVVASLFSDARRANLQAIPVIRTTYSQEMLQQLQTEIARDGRGCLLRVRPLEFYKSPRPSITALLAFLGQSPANVHFMLDYGSANMQLADDLPLVPNLSRWRTLIAAAGSFPASLSNFPPLQWRSVPRQDWETWKNGINTPSLLRLATFADYTCRFPGRSPDGGMAGVNLRYATDTEWVVQVGGLVKDGSSPNMVRIFGRLMSHPACCNSSHCAGDAEYHSRVPPSTNWGNATQWVQWSVNHHLVSVTNALTSFAWP